MILVEPKRCFLESGRRLECVELVLKWVNLFSPFFILFGEYSKLFVLKVYLPYCVPYLCGSINITILNWILIYHFCLIKLCKENFKLVPHIPTPPPPQPCVVIHSNKWYRSEVSHFLEVYHSLMCYNRCPYDLISIFCILLFGNRRCLLHVLMVSTNALMVGLNLHGLTLR